MKKKRYVIVGAIMLICTVVVLAACSGNNAKSPENVKSEAQDSQVNMNTSAETSSAEAESYMVVFKNGNGEILGSETVPSGEIVAPPEIPELPYGEIFLRWDQVLDAITTDTTVQTVSESVLGKPNVFALSGGYVSVDSTVAIPFQLCGDVELCGFDVTIQYDPEVLEFVDFTDEDDAIISNCIPESGTIRINYLSTENTIGDVDCCDLLFRALKFAEDTKLTITVNSIIALDENEQVYAPDYHVIHSEIHIMPAR